MDRDLLEDLFRTAVAAADLGRAGSVARGQSYRTEYEHLAQLFVEHAALPEDNPHRERLRNELIAGYLPVARHIARKFRYRGEPPQDLEQVPIEVERAARLRIAVLLTD